jgi:hypothetical protein
MNSFSVFLWVGVEEGGSGDEGSVDSTVGWDQMS